MKKYIFAIIILSSTSIAFSQKGWDYFTLGPHLGNEIANNNSLYNINLQLDHFKQISREDIYSNYYYQSFSFNYGFNNNDINYYSLQSSFNIVKKRLFEYYDKWYFNKRNIPPEKRNFIHITGLRLYPTVLFEPAIYNYNKNQSYFFRPGAGLVINYGHLATWSTDVRIITSYQYNFQLSGQTIPGLKNNIFTIRIGLGFKLK